MGNKLTAAAFAAGLVLYPMNDANDDDAGAVLNDAFLTANSSGNSAEVPTLKVFNNEACLTGELGTTHGVGSNGRFEILVKGTIVERPATEILDSNKYGIVIEQKGTRFLIPDCTQA